MKQRLQFDATDQHGGRHITVGTVACTTWTWTSLARRLRRREEVLSTKLTCDHQLFFFLLQMKQTHTNLDYLDFFRPRLTLMMNMSHSSPCEWHLECFSHLHVSASRRPHFSWPLQQALLCPEGMICFISVKVFLHKI